MIQKLKRKLAMYKFRRQVRRCANHTSDDDTHLSACFVYSSDDEYQKLSQMIKRELRTASKGYCFDEADTSNTYTLPNRNTISIVKAMFI